MIDRFEARNKKYLSNMFTYFSGEWKKKKKIKNCYELEV